MAGFIIVDNDVLSALSQEAVNYNPSAMNALLVPGYKVVITSTIYGEATRYAATNEYSAFRKNWLDANILSKKIVYEETPVFPEGVEHAGELSMIEVGATRYLGKSVTYVSNDSFFTDMGGSGFNAVNLIPGQTHNTGQGFLFKSLVEGGMSTLEYQVSSYNLQDTTSERPFLDIGGSVVGSNGVVFLLSPAGIIARQPNGGTVTIAPNERFVTDPNGIVTVIGIYVPSADGGMFIPTDQCFGGKVPIDMWPLGPEFAPDPNNPQKIFDQDAVRAKVWKKPIELIRVGDIVVSFDGNGNLVPGRVTRTMTNEVKILLNFHGTRVTPGHVYHRPDSKRPHKFEALIDILRDDGVIKHRDGTLIRAATNAPVGSPRDGFVRAVTSTRKADGTFEPKDEGRIRIGTRFLVGVGSERKSFAVADLIEAGGGIVGEDELIRVGDGAAMPFHWEFGNTLPKPEDFVLACSSTTLEDIYKAAEWESQGPRLPAPMVLDRGPVQPLKGAALSAMPRNEPLNVLHVPMAPAKPQQTLNRRQRKAMEATQRKAAKSGKRIAGLC
jgi:hypothetical protein